MGDNELFRQARLARPSQRQPGAALSLDELAELVKAYLADEYRVSAPVDKSYVSKVERAVVRWPRSAYRAAFRAVLQAPDDAALGFAPPRRARAEGPPRAVPGLPGLELSAVPAILPDAAAHVPAPFPTRVDPAVIAQAWDAAQVFAGWDHRYGPVAQGAALAQLHWSAALLGDANCPVALRPALLSAVAFLAHTSGFMAFDGGSLAVARQAFRLGLACTDEAGDGRLRARLYASLSRLETWAGDPAKGLTYAQLALARPGRLTPALRAMAHCARARAYARLGQHAGAREAIAAGDQALAQHRPGQEPPWMSYYDVAQHAGDIGAALVSLALGDQPPPGAAAQARERLEVAIDRRPPDQVRSKALSQLSLATLVMATGDPAEAAAVATAALGTAGLVRSFRIAQDVAALGTLAGRHAGHSDLEAVRHLIATVAP